MSLVDKVVCFRHFPTLFNPMKAHRGKQVIILAKKENYLPINAFYMTCLRDKRSFNRDYPEMVINNKRTGEVKRVVKKERMDSIDMLIYILLLSRADSTTYKCFPSIDQIGIDCMGLDRHTVIEHLENLEQMKYILTDKKKGLSTVYYMLDYADWLKDPHY